MEILILSFKLRIAGADPGAKGDHVEDAQFEEVK